MTVSERIGTFFLLIAVSSLFVLAFLLLEGIIEILYF